MDDLKETNRLLIKIKDILKKNTIYTGGGFLIGAVALVVALIALLYH